MMLKRLPRMSETAQKRYLPVLLCLAVTGALTLKTAFECHSTLVMRHYDAPFTPSLLRSSVVWGWWGTCALVLWNLSGRWPRRFHLSLQTVLSQAAVDFAVSGAHTLVLRGTMIVLGTHWPGWGLFFQPLGHFTGERFSIDLTIYGFIFAAVALLRTHFEARQALLGRSELERQLSQAQLLALRTQLEPHFLFNTLNCIGALVDLGRNAQANEALAHLNTILRSTLERGDASKIPVHEEFRTLQSYLAIQKMRLAGRLEVSFETTPEAMDGLIPAFLLQPIVENAIQHGIAPRRRGGLIQTRIQCVEGKLQMTIADDGCGAAAEKSMGFGIGLSNTQERLRCLYGDVHRFRAAARINGGFEVFIEIPYENEHDAAARSHR